MRGAVADDVAEAQDDAAQSERGAERGDERLRRDLARAVKADGQRGAERFARHRRAHVAINRAGAGQDDLRNGVKAHGFEDVVGDEGFLLQVQSGVFETPARVGIGREMINAINAFEMRQRLFQIEQIELGDFEARVVFVLRQVLAAAGGKIVEQADFPCRGVREQGINQMRADKTGAAGDEII